MESCDVVLGLEWLHILGHVTMDFMDLYMIFSKEGNTHTLKDLTSSFPKIMTSQHMENLLNKGHLGVIAQYNSIQVVDTPPQEIHPNL